ncbi:MAG: dephospho-CoA kinase [Alphaproteobacteria bacterium]
MRVIGLTGSIGMGKSETARMLRARGVPVFSADEEVHRLTAPGGAALHAISRAFPGMVTNGRLDRQALAKLVFDKKRDPERRNLRRLESILHPRVRAAEARFLKAARAARKPLAALDIPLLLESGSAGRVDAVLVVSAPQMVQTARVLRRPGMDRSKLAAVRAAQLPDAEKRRRADHVLPTGLNRRDTLARLARLLPRLAAQRGERRNA